MNNSFNQVVGFNYGWICPKCGSVYAPTQTECYRCAPVTKYEFSSTTVALNDYENWKNKEETKIYGKDGQK